MNYLEKVLCIVAVVLVQSCAVGKTSIRQDIKYVNNWQDAPIVSVLIPDVTVTLYAVGRGSVRLKDTETKVSNYLLRKLPEILKQNGFIPGVAEFSPNDPDIIAMKSDYNKLSESILYNSSYNYPDVLLRTHAGNAFAVDESVKHHLMQGLSGQTKANLIMIVKYSGNHKVSSKIAEKYDVDALFSTNAVIYRPRGYVDTTSGVLEIAVIERKTGKLFWSNRVEDSYDFLSCLVTDSIDKICKDHDLGLSRFPNKNTNK